MADQQIKDAIVQMIGAVCELSLTEQRQVLHSAQLLLWLSPHMQPGQIHEVLQENIDLGYIQMNEDGATFALTPEGKRFIELSGFVAEIM